MQTKTCTTCHLAKPLAEFSKARRPTGRRQPRGGLGVAAMCRACVSHRRDPALAERRAATTKLASAGLKRCGMCHTVKPIANFNGRRASPDGVAHSCQDCVRAAIAQWRVEHPGAYSAWHQQNKDRKQQYWRKWSGDNQQRRQDNYKKWSTANHGKVIANVRRRYAAKMNAAAKWANRPIVDAFYAEARRLTATTSVRHVVDHIVPLRSRIVCGLHVEFNLQILTHEQNQRKSNHHDPLQAGREAMLACDTSQPSLLPFLLSA